MCRAVWPNAIATNNLIYLASDKISCYYKNKKTKIELCKMFQ